MVDTQLFSVLIIMSHVAGNTHAEVLVWPYVLSRHLGAQWQSHMVTRSFSFWRIAELSSKEPCTVLRFHQQCMPSQNAGAKKTFPEKSKKVVPWGTAMKAPGGPHTCTALCSLQDTSRYTGWPRDSFQLHPHICTALWGAQHIHMHEPLFQLEFYSCFYY